jgi:hypothetical protein
MTRLRRYRSYWAGFFLDGPFFFGSLLEVPGNLSGLIRVVAFNAAEAARTRQEMSRLTVGILGAIALSLVSGAAQFALGRDMAPAPMRLTRGIAPLPAAKSDRLQPLQEKFTRSSLVNRKAKSDRAASPAIPAAPTRTVSLQPDGFLDTSFLLRVPEAREDSARPPARFRVRKLIVACEPVVSVLTEIAKQIEPGRCVT